MRKNFGPQTWLYPQMVLIIGTYDEHGSPDAMNAAWGGTYGANQVVISLGLGHKSTKNLLEKKAFTVSFATADTVVPCDYVGIVSANDVPDKFQRAGFTASRAQLVDAPVIDQLPLTLECRLVKLNEDNKVIGEVVNVSADESILDENGAVDPEKIGAIVFDPINKGYYKVGEKAGQAFSDGKKIQ